jgi:phage baseplate assembly protein W
MMVQLKPDDDFTEAQDLIFQEIEETLKDRSRTEERAQILIREAEAARVSLRTVAEMIFDGKKFGEILTDLRTRQRENLSK